MDRDLKNMDEKALLRELVITERRNLSISRISAAAAILLAAALVIALIVLVPRLSETLTLARSTIDATQQLVQRINGALDTLDELSANVTSFTSENAETLNRLTELFSQIDLKGLTESIQKFNAVAEYLANFRLFG